MEKLLEGIRVKKIMKFLAIDLGAESGRGITGSFDGKRISLSITHRFPNGGVRILDSLHWDLPFLWKEIKQVLGMSANSDLKSIGIDTWGVDFGLLDADGQLIGQPYHYRDERTNGMMELAFELLPKKDIFAQTGIQFMQINTLYQLLSMVNSKSPIFEIADTFLTIPDLLNFWLTGRKVSEFSNATTTQILDPRTATWSELICKKFQIPYDIFPDTIFPGEEIGLLRPSVGKETGLSRVPVVAPACHDTGSAIVAVPAHGNNWAYISSGTWSLMGVELDQPLITGQALALNFTNEGGFNRTSRFLKNIMGLWLVQECRRTWAQSTGTEMEYSELTQLAKGSTAFVSVIDPDDSTFLPAGDMPKRIVDYCHRTGQVAPDTPGAFVRCALESLAFKYRWTLEQIESVTGRHIDTLHIVGGGVQNQLLCQFTADATGKQVVAGPVEATAIGNIAVQAIAINALSTLDEARQVIKNSFSLQIYDPNNNQEWQDAYQSFLQITRIGEC